MVLSPAWYRLWIFLTHFPCANRHPPRIKSGAGFARKRYSIFYPMERVDGGLSRGDLQEFVEHRLLQLPRQGLVPQCKADERPIEDVCAGARHFGRMPGGSEQSLHVT